jgi:hypothetical protein
MNVELLDARIAALETRVGKVEAGLQDLIASLGSLSNSSIAAQCPDTAPAQSGAYVQADVEAITTELRALKTALRAENIILT